MITEHLRDAQFTAAWFGLMTMVWFGWAQEAPPKSARVWLGLGSVLGVALAATFAVIVAFNWGSPSALEGRYAWFGVLTGIELLAAGGGCLVLARRGRHRWMAWWVGLVVALHFVPLGILLGDWSVSVLGGLMVGALVALLPRLRRGTATTSSTVGPVMGSSLLVYGLATAAVIGFSA